MPQSTRFRRLFAVITGTRQAPRRIPGKASRSRSGAEVTRFPEQQIPAQFRRGISEDSFRTPRVDLPPSRQADCERLRDGPGKPDLAFSKRNLTPERMVSALTAKCLGLPACQCGLKRRQTPTKRHEPQRAVSARDRQGPRQLRAGIAPGPQFCLLDSSGTRP